MSTSILGISALYHDAAAVLLRDGALVAAAQEERFTRIKHDASLPVRAVEWCLEEAGIKISEVDHIVFYEKPLRKFERIITMDMSTFPRSWRAFPRHMRVWLGDKLWTRNNISKAFSYPAEKILFSEHHLSHAASAFFCSPYDDAAILTVDGVGELATTGLWRGSTDPCEIEALGELRFPHSLGMLYSSLTAYLGFRVNEGEYKVMGMAPYGRPRFTEELGELIRFDDDGGFTLNLDYFSFHYHPTRSFSPKLEKLLGPSRPLGTDFFPEQEPGEGTPEEVASSQRYADIAASTQKLLEDAMLRLARQAHALVGGKRLCLAGGVALNSVANHRIAQDSPFEEVWVQPSAGDGGGALGAALWAWHMVLGEQKRYRLGRPDLGKAWRRDEVKSVLDDLALPYEDLGSAQAGADRAADELAEGGVIAWFEGRFEWGPRALGHRSILADPRKAEMKDTVNARIKFREAFRPFAPSVIEEAATRWFQLDPAAKELGPYMLAACPVSPDLKDRIPAVTHIDGSARVQVVRESHHPLYHRLIHRFGQNTGVPIVLNTSFNLKGEPVVASPVDALATLMRCELDCLYIEGFRVEGKK